MTTVASSSGSEQVGDLSPLEGDNLGDLQLWTEGWTGGDDIETDYFLI